MTVRHCSRSWRAQFWQPVPCRPHAPRPAPLQGLLQLFDSNGLPVPLHKCGQCMYRLGPAGCKLSLRLVNGRLMARSGAGQTMDILAWLEKQPAAEQQQRRQQHPGPLR